MAPPTSTFTADKHNGTDRKGGFLSFNRSPPRVVVSADATEDDFDQDIMNFLEDEGFEVFFLPFEGGGKEYINELNRQTEDLELGMGYALVVFGIAATEALAAALKPMNKMNALIAYYPTQIPAQNASFPPSLRTLVHLAGGKPYEPRYPNYTYPGVLPGFAEQNSVNYDKVAASLAWSRTLGLVRKASNTEVDLEHMVEDHLTKETTTRSASATLKTLTPAASAPPEPHITYTPTLTGGVGHKDLKRFYKEFFMPRLPRSYRTQLISRTIGVDRVVDELIVSFDHDVEIPFMLPGLPPTGKHVEVPLISIVCVRGGKVAHERVYWDQASVLVQAGVLDPGTAGVGKAHGKRLPVVSGAEAAAVVRDEQDAVYNKLIPDW
ncbi:MAG: hypothetical protein M1819_002466 [Sarea resinae]|nr:MAG: hypothetical protein M1819_002466 [Sarea resinae]